MTVYDCSESWNIIIPTVLSPLDTVYYMSYSLNSLIGGYMGDCTGDYIGVNEGSQDKGAHKQNVT